MSKLELNLTQKFELKTRIGLIPSGRQLSGMPRYPPGLAGYRFSVKNGRISKQYLDNPDTQIPGYLVTQITGQF